MINTKTVKKRKGKVKGLTEEILSSLSQQRLPRNGRRLVPLLLIRLRLLEKQNQDWGPKDRKGSTRYFGSLRVMDMMLVIAACRHST